jgi:GAF domain-containing protein
VVWLQRRSDTLHLWTAGWCAITGLYLISHYVQLTSEVLGLVVLASRVTWACALLLIPVSVGLTQTIVRGRCSRPSISLLGGLSASLVLVTALTSLIVTDQTYRRTDRLGDQYWAPLPGPLMTVLIPYFLTAFIYALRLSGEEAAGSSERRMFLVGFSVYIACALNDALHAARLITASAYSTTPRGGGARARVPGGGALRAYPVTEIEVSRKPASSGPAGAARVLVRAGQVVMAGLDLQAVLTRLIGEASRISGAPRGSHARDSDSRTLGCAQLGTRFLRVSRPGRGEHLGAVAERGEPIYVPEVLTTPQLHPGPRSRRRNRRVPGLPIGPPRGSWVPVFKTIVPRSFDADEMAVLTSFAHQAAIAIENARLYSALEDRIKRLDTLAGLNRLISESLDVDHPLKQIARAAAALMNAALVTVWSADEGRQLIQARASSNDELLAELPRRTRPFGQGVVGWVALNRRPRSVADFENEGQTTQGQWFLQHGFRSGVALPILRGSRLLGVLSLVFRAPLKPNVEEDPQLQAFIDQAAIAIEHGRLYANLEDRVSQLKTVTRLNRAISSALDSDSVLRKIAEAAAQLPGATVASIWLAREESRTLEVVSLSDPVIDAEWTVRTMSFEQGLNGWVARHGRVLNVPDVFKDERFIASDWWRRHGLSSFLGVPVILDGVLLAVLALNGREPFQFDAEEELMLESLGAQAALAIRNASLFADESFARRTAERALAEVSLLQGMLPICSYCKKIRKDQDSWEQLESYISEHTHATFSHGICPDWRSTVVADHLEQWRRGP